MIAWDFTWSVAKSISLTHAGLLAEVAEARDRGDTATAEHCQRQANQILDAIRETAAEIVARFEATACFTRTGGFHGAGGDGAYRDGAGVIGAAFLQSTNRDNDPHLHVHTVIANLVQRADGGDDAYRTLYGRPLLRARGQLDAIAKRRLASKLEKLGIPLVQRADSDGFEVGGVAQEQIDAFSSRKTAVTQGVWTHDGKKRLRGCGCPCDRGEFCGGCGHARCGWHLAPGMEALIEAYTAKHGRAAVARQGVAAARAGVPQRTAAQERGGPVAGAAARPVGAARRRARCRGACFDPGRGRALRAEPSSAPSTRPGAARSRTGRRAPSRRHRARPSRPAPRDPDRRDRGAEAELVVVRQ